MYINLYWPTAELLSESWRPKAKYPLVSTLVSKELLDSPLKCETNEKIAHQVTKSCDLGVGEDSRIKSRGSYTFLNMYS